ncbi:porin [Rugamonas sp.]|uniref:porin n=1 Tax=Rugamonas sp. TaxID=1926287 RepID=UPI0025DDC7D8|nr:porin [Rugamonas sp.]
MKKSLITIAALGALSNVAMAQSNVTIYGLLDAAVVSERGGAAGSVTKLTGGVSSASRLGFKGTEDLGGGLSAVFVLEEGVLIDTGSQDSAGQAFNRQSYVGLSSKDAGTITLGRQYTMLYNAIQQVGDPFGAGYAGTAKNLFPVAGAEIRANNAVVYSSPKINGFSGDAMYSLGEQAGNNSAGRQFGLGLAYANGPLNARLVYNNKNSDTSNNTVVAPAIVASSHDIGRNVLFAANYDFSVAKAYFMFGSDKGFNSAPLYNTTAKPYGSAFAASVDSNDLLIGTTVPVGQSGTVMASYLRKNDKTSFNQDADQYGIGYSYALSKRTSTYVAYAKIKNKNGAGYTVGNNTEAGTGDKAVNIGMKHTF